MAGHADGAFRRSLADRVRFARRLGGMSQHQLAAAIGASAAQVRRYETAAAAISAATLLRIAVALDVPLGWLYGIDDGDHWPDTLLAALFRDPQMPALVNAFSRIADDESRRLVLVMADGLGTRSRSTAPPARPLAASVC
jgi:transcriptional regulator with XRE-family HTH domain